MTTMTIHLSDAAQDHILELMTEEGDLGLRLEVIAGGCAGYQYRFTKATEENEENDDLIICGSDGDGLLYIDPTSAEKIDGATIDYEKTIMTQQFVVKNPNADVTCGCGISFQ